MRLTLEMETFEQKKNESKGLIEISVVFYCSTMEIVI